ncbi:hypothetical protein MBRA_52630 (plasmid) [Mycobacterium branderi]|uniref:Uncharacterized protein n=1 Tax=Mycobacterium branderi TaxID=43348 RepID=A0ABN6BDI9_9MYCO|nr:hypothetical protein MBRA_52630 [Mycobacterium branderi]
MQGVRYRGICLSCDSLQAWGVSAKAPVVELQLDTVDPRSMAEGFAVLKGANAALSDEPLEWVSVCSRSGGLLWWTSFRGAACHQTDIRHVRPGTDIRHPVGEHALAAALFVDDTPQSIAGGLRARNAMPAQNRR